MGVSEREPGESAETSEMADHPSVFTTLQHIGIMKRGYFGIVLTTTLKGFIFTPKINKRQRIIADCSFFNLPED